MNAVNASFTTMGIRAARGAGAARPITGEQDVTDNDKPVWFITGCSTGFGHELAKLIVARGYRLVATARDAARVRVAPCAALTKGLVGAEIAEIGLLAEAGQHRRGGTEEIGGVDHKAGVDAAGQLDHRVSN